jgi:O-acetyl-ADP-ribose deacetylase (regulator of RNase III)
MPMKIILGDITCLDVDAIVNAANPTLLGGGGVDGAIHAAAGPGLARACRSLPLVAAGVRCPSGEARITPGFALAARFVIHTVGPIWHGGHQGEARLLAQCYRRSLHLLREHKLRTIAFPAISCGVYGYPLEQAARIAISTLDDELKNDDTAEVTLCCFNATVREALLQVSDRN